MSSVEKINVAQNLPTENNTTDSSNPDDVLKDKILLYYDSNKDGEIDKAEAYKYFKEAPGFAYEDENLNLHFLPVSLSLEIATADLKSYDKNSDGFISQYEANKLVLEGRQEEILKEYDHNEDGKLDRAEASKYFEEADEYSIPLSMKMTTDDLKIYDQNNDGVIDLWESQNLVEDNKILKEYDHNEDGKLDRAEASKYFEGADGYSTPLSLRITTDDLKIYDKNNDGFISQYEAHKLVLKVMQEKILQEYDHNGDGKIDRAEASECFEGPDKYSTYLSLEIATDDLKIYDKNNDGFINSWGEGQQIIRENKQEEILKEYDHNGDGKIDRAEACKYFEEADEYSSPLFIKNITDDLKIYDKNNDGVINFYEGKGIIEDTKQEKLQKKYDHNGDGKIDRAEASEYFGDGHLDDGGSRSPILSCSIVTDDLKIYDKNNDGVINSFEGQQIIKENKQEEILQDYDYNRDRKLNAAELKSYFTVLSYNGKISVDLVTDDLKIYDTNNDGVIDFLESLKIKKS